MTWQEQRPRDPQQQHGFDLIGAAIKRRRVSLRWTHRQLEAYSGIDQTNISRMENGNQYGFRWSRFADLVDALGGLDAGPHPAWGDRPFSAPPERIDLDVTAEDRAAAPDDAGDTTPMGGTSRCCPQASREGGDRGGPESRIKEWG